MKQLIFLALIIFTLAGFLQSQTVTLTYPNGGETWMIGNTYPITWTSSGVTENIRLKLYKGNASFGPIVSSTTDDGSHDWTVPETLNGNTIVPGTDYKIRIETVSENAYDWSDNNFTISMPVPGSLHLTRPVGGENWKIGDTEAITWSSTGITQNMRLKLYKGTTSFGAITGNTANDGSYGWTIPTSLNGHTLTPASDYRIRIETISENHHDSSDGFFAISPELGPPPVVQKPDLRVSELTYTMRNNPPRSCDTITFVRVRAKVKNIGSLGCNRVSHARLTITGPEPFAKIEKTFLISKLAQNGSDSISWEYKPHTYGIYKHQVEVDIGNSLNEESESNNKKKQLLGVNPLPDLVVCVSCGKRPPVGGKRDVHAWVKNVGQFDAVNFRLRFYVKQKGTTYHTIGRLKPGKMVRITRRHRWGLSGSKNITARVDCDGTVREMSEHNNYVKAKYFVRLPHHVTYGVAKHSCLEGFYGTDSSISENHCCSYAPYQIISTAKIKVKIK